VPVNCGLGGPDGFVRPPLDPESVFIEPKSASISRDFIVPVLGVKLLCHLFGSSTVIQSCAYFGLFTSGKHLKMQDICGKVIRKTPYSKEWLFGIEW
jgi:hypothetical protein